MKMNEQCWIELLVLDCNTWNHLTVCKNLLEWALLEITSPVKTNEIELSMLEWNTWNHFARCKQMGIGSFKNVTYKLFVYK